MNSILENLFILTAFLLIGWGLRKSGRLNAHAAQALAALEVWVFLPAMNLRTFAARMRVDTLREKGLYLLVSVGILAVLIPFARFAARLLGHTSEERAVFAYTFTIPNYGYMGYALMLACCGEEMLLNMMVFVLPLSLFTYTEGYRMLTGGGMQWKRLINPVIGAVVMGCIVGLCGWTLPAAADRVLQQAANCMAPVSMLLTGITIAEFSARKVLRDGRLALVTGLRLLVLPAALTAAVSLLHQPELTMVCLMVYAMPCGLNTVIFPRLAGKDCSIGAGLALLSNAACIASIPLLQFIFQNFI